MENALLVVHILAAGAWLGGGVTQLVVNRGMWAKRGEPAAAWVDSTVKMGTRLYTPAAVVLLVTGIWMVLISTAYEFSNTFVSIGFAMVIIGGAFGGLVFGPVGRRAAAAFRAGEDSEADAATARLLRFGSIDLALLTVTIVAMVYRWGA